MVAPEKDEQGKVFDEFVAHKTYQNQDLYSNPKDINFEKEYPEHFMESLPMLKDFMYPH